MFRGDVRIWAARSLILAGVVAAWASSGVGFVVGGLMIAIAGVVALATPSKAGALQMVANSSLVLVGLVLVGYGLG
jgi:hypothetical protein